MESFIKRLLWKAFFFDNKSNNEVESDEKPTYEFKSEHCPPQHKALTFFENDMYDLARNIRVHGLQCQAVQQRRYAQSTVLGRKNAYLVGRPRYKVE